MYLSNLVLLTPSYVLLSIITKQKPILAFFKSSKVNLFLHESNYSIESLLVLFLSMWEDRQSSNLLDEEDTVVLSLTS